MAAPRQLSALDSAFLAAETPRTPLHVGAVSFFEGAPLRDGAGHLRIGDLQRLVESRLPAVPRFRQRPVTVGAGLMRPWWVDDPAFDVAHHVRAVSLEPPGTTDQLYRLTATLHMELLDRNRPLWELWIVDGLRDGRIAVIEKVHHSVIDGVAGVDVATALMDLSPEPGPTLLPVPPPGDGVLAGLARRAATTGKAWLDAATHPSRFATDAAALAKGAASLVSGGFLAPRSSLNQPIGDTRILEATFASLPELKENGKALGATVNDLALAAVAGGLRRLFQSRGENLDGRSLNALVPVSTRSVRGATELGNSVAAIVAPLPVGLADASERVAAVHAAMAQRKGSGQARFTGVLTAAADWLPATLAGAVGQMVHRQPFINVVVTNVPGVTVPLYMMGARMDRSIPVVPLAGNLDVSVGIMSYRHELAFGLYADAKTCPDVSVLAEGITTSFDEIYRLVHPRGRRPAYAKGA